MSVKKSAMRALSIVLCLAMFAGIGFTRFTMSASADALVRVVNGKALMSSSVTFIQAYIDCEKDVSTEVSFFAATGLDVYGFSSCYGGDVDNVKSDPSETHLTGTDGDYYVTWTNDRSLNPYQAFEADVSGIVGNIIIGYDGKLHDTDTNGSIILQVWSPAENKYIKMDECGVVSGTGVPAGSVSVCAEINAAEYSENGIVRYRVVLPTDAAYKWIYTRHATVGQVDESTQYGTTKTRTKPGNASLNYKGEVVPGMCFCVKTETDAGYGYSMIFPFSSENTAQSQLAHFNVNFNGDACTTRNMSWVSKNDLAAAVVQVVPYGKLDPDFTNARTYIGKKDRIKNAEKPYGFYVTVDDLEPDTEYWYRYGDGNSVWSSPCYLRTDDGDAHFSFMMSGDPQSYTDSTDEAQIEKVFGQYRQVGYSFNEAKRTTGAEFMVVCGDESDQGNYESCWDWYYDKNQTFYRSSTLAPTMGNHDSWGWDMWLANHFLSDPDTGERGSYCSFDYGNAHFIILNGNIAEANNRRAMRDKEYAWLIRDLEEHKDADFKFIIEHQGMYSYPGHTYEAETVEIRSILVPIIDEYGVDFMMQGHDHIWLRTSSMEGGRNVSPGNTTTITDIVTGDTYIVDPQGTTYCNGGSLTGSKYHNPNPANFLTLISVACAAQPNMPTYNTFEIDGGKLKFKGWAFNKSTGAISRIGQYSHYGNETDGYSIVKTSYYTKINNRINALPETLTLEDREEVLALKKMCDAESETFLDAYVPDAYKLVAAYETVEQLYQDSIIKGDLDGDGEVTVADALAALRVAVGLADQPEGDALIVADVDCDGEVTVSDALHILRFVAKLVDEL